MHLLSPYIICDQRACSDLRLATPTSLACGPLGAKSSPTLAMSAKHQAVITEKVGYAAESDIQRVFANMIVAGSVCLHQQKTHQNPSHAKTTPPRMRQPIHTSSLRNVAKPHTMTNSSVRNVSTKPTA